MIDFLGTTPDPTPGTLPSHWHAGWPSPKHDPAPEIQVHAYTEHTVLLRQNMSVHFEAPFLFLLFGNERALLLDTGASPDPAHFPLRATVDALIEEWLGRHPRTGYELLVAHTHGHGDHIAADAQFADRPATTVVPPGLADVTRHFGFTDWPHRPAELDLGGRVLDLVPGPGHHPAAVVFYDRHTGLLLTGDSLYPGRLYVDDAAAYAETADRLIDFCATRPVSHVLGCHIEMTTTPDEDYPRGTTHQPDEPPLQLTAAHLHTLRRALAETAGRPGAHPYGDFVLVHRG
ncbi:MULTISPECIES: MBL fold metallo-hydrolase [unclassified Streptomyces]|uniref:MBL fold metallo-hydrolase n=1 Tax=unclassified Streptomyces TaxID=2593676 RepID=UPI0033C9CD98